MHVEAEEGGGDQGAARRGPWDPGGGGIHPHLCPGWDLRGPVEPGWAELELGWAAGPHPAREGRSWDRAGGRAARSLTWPSG